MATHLTTALPDLDWKTGDVITVDTGSNLALITAVHLRVTQADGQSVDVTVPDFPALYAYGPVP